MNSKLETRNQNKLIRNVTKEMMNITKGMISIIGLIRNVRKSMMNVPKECYEQGITNQESVEIIEKW